MLILGGRDSDASIDEHDTVDDYVCMYYSRVGLGCVLVPSLRRGLHSFTRVY